MRGKMIGDGSHIPVSKLFKSFWLAGYESAYHINAAGHRLDMTAATQHDRQVATDYALLKEFGITTVREAIRWLLVEPRNLQYDFSTLAPMVDAANKANIQVIWDICHFGWPDGLDVFSPEFVKRFASLCKVVSQFLKQYSDGPRFYVPINEMSFLSWAAAHIGWFYPYAKNRGDELKRQLIRATIAGMDEIWSDDPTARFVIIDPVLYVVPPHDYPELKEAAAAKHQSQYAAWDMLCGRIAPELGGDMRYLDILALNYYHSNQFEYEGERLFWEEPVDDRRIPFATLMAEVYERYRRPMIIGETSHFGVGRGRWIEDIGREVCEAARQGVPISAICIYPIIDRSDWEDDMHWHNSGLWDLEREADGRLRRVLNVEYAASLKRTQALLAKE